MQSHGIEMIVLIKNKPIHEYQYNDQFFIEGRSGSNYEIELRNHTNGRVQTVLSVDGLSVIDGKEAGPHSRSYLIDAHSTLRVPGWLLDEGNAAKFAFAGRPDSYASQISDGKTRNVGVIGVLVYTEKVAPVSFPTYPFYSWDLNNAGVPYPFYQNINTSSTSNAWDAPRGIACSANSASASPFIGASFSNNAVPMSRGSSAGEQKTSGGVIGGSPAPQQSLGTAFGDQTQFATRSVVFDRGAQLTVMSLYYDSLKGLRAKGVPIERRGKSHRPPEAFPGMSGCTPPRGWRMRGSLERTGGF